MLRTLMKKIVTISPVSSPVIAEAVAEAPADPCEPLRLLLAQREFEVVMATQALATGFTVELLASLNGAVGNLNTAKAALATKVAEVNAAQFIPSMVTLLAGAAKDVPHAVWGSQVRFEVTFTSEGVPSVRRIAQAAAAPSGTYSPSRTVRNRTASGVRDARLPGQGWWFASGRLVIRIADDSDQVSGWQIGGPPMLFGSISSACSKLLGTSTNGYAYTNLGSTEDAWSDASPRKGWSCGELPANLKPGQF
jgi:hypothetical protein